MKTLRDAIVLLAINGIIQLGHVILTVVLKLDRSRSMIKSTNIANAMSLNFTGLKFQTDATGTVLSNKMLSLMMDRM